MLLTVIVNYSDLLEKGRRKKGYGTLMFFYYALAQSLIEYYVVTWRGNGISNMLALERAQRVV